MRMCDVMVELRARLGAWTVLALTALCPSGIANEQIILRSGYDEQAGVPLALCAFDSNLRCIAATAEATPLRLAPFTAADFAAARTSSQQARVITLSVWPQSLTADPLARKVHWKQSGSCSDGKPANSALFAMDFNVETTCAATATVELAWFVDDSLGDNVSGIHNPCGLFINEQPVGAQFQGTSSMQYVSQSGVPIRSGVNTLYIYGRDIFGSDFGVMFSARITVEELGGPEVIMVRSGYDETLQSPHAVCLPDLNLRSSVAGAAGQPLSTAPFTPSVFTAAQAGATPALRVVTPLPAWPASLAADPNARYVHRPSVTPCLGGQPALSTLFAQPFVVESATATTATVEFAWFIDDGLGDHLQPGTEHNPYGLYLNGNLVGTQFFGQQSQSYVKQTQVPIQPGSNWLYVYARDSGGTDCGTIYSARITIECSVFATPFCLADASQTNCPCSNNSAAGSGAGCRHSLGGGAKLSVSGSLESDPITLVCTGMPPNALCALMRSTQLVTTPLVAGDGLSCLGESPFVFTMNPQVAVGGTSSFEFQALSPGQTRYFQVVYRDAMNPAYCTPANLNYSNGLAVSW